MHIENNGYLWKEMSRDVHFLANYYTAWAITNIIFNIRDKG